MKNNLYPYRGYEERDGLIEVAPGILGRSGEKIIYRDNLPVIERQYNFSNLEIRQLEDADEFGVQGYGLKWDTVANIGWFTESFRKGAFKDTLEDVRFLIGHNYGMVALARSPTSWQISEDDVGLRFEGNIDIANNIDARNLASAMTRGDIDKMSIGFSGLKYEYTEGYEDDNGNWVRPHYDIISVKKLWEISAVNWPAHESSELEAKNKVTKTSLTTLRNRGKFAAARMAALPANL